MMKGYVRGSCEGHANSTS